MIGPHLESKFFDGLYQPFQNITIDETMFPLKRRAPFRQYIKSKPGKWDLKLWCLADSMNCYIHSFIVYTGVKEQGQGSLSCHVALHLIQKRRLVGFGYDVFVDIFCSFS